MMRVICIIFTLVLGSCCACPPNTNVDNSYSSLKDIVHLKEVENKKYDECVILKNKELIQHIKDTENK